MSFAKQVVVVPGATGVVGSGAVRAYLDEGATVVAISRSQSKLDALRKTLNVGAGAPLHEVVGDFVDEASAMATAERARAAVKGAPIDHVISSVGFVTMGAAPTETPLALFRQALDDGLFNTFLVAKAFLPLLKGRQGATFTMVSGGLAHIPPPMPPLWLATIKNSAVNALTMALGAETANDAVKVSTVCIHFAVAPVGGAQNQLGMAAAHDTLSLGRSFLGVARAAAKGQLVCLNDWADAEHWAKRA